MTIETILEEPARYGFFRGIKRTLIGAAVLLTLDVGMSGSFLMSAIACPIWFVVTFLKSLFERPGWSLALVRIGIPLLTITIVRVNDDYQRQVAETNALRVVAACESYHAENGCFPKKLNDLVPQYLSSIPPAKYTLGPYGHFSYVSLSPEHAMLWWPVVPPYYRKIYNFETRTWSYLD